MNRKETVHLPLRPPLTPPLDGASFGYHPLVDSNYSLRQQSSQMAYELNGQYAAAQFQKPHPGVGLGIQFTGYHHQQPNLYDDSHQSRTSSPFMQQGMPLTSPPTPMSHHSEGRRTRSGRSIVRTNSPHSSGNRSPPARATRKKKTSASEKHKTPKLTAPLSVLTKDMTGVPVRDMEAWAQRPLEERHKEVEKRNGYVTRPMNSFMLYRSAYADRTKIWCLHNNHQVVSSVSGESWPLEPPEVREFYNELAKIERQNHQLAHPKYKFSPSKPGAAASSKKRARSDSVGTETSDLDDPDWAASNGVRSRPAKRPGREAGYPAHANFGGVPVQYHEMYNRPAMWEQPVHAQQVHHMAYQQMPQAPQPQHFYPSPTMQHQQLHHMMPAQHQPQEQHQDLYGSFDDMSFPANESLIGLPGANHAELLGLHSDAPTPLEHQLDPMLLAFDERHHSSGQKIEDGLTLTQHAEYESSFDHQFAEQMQAHGYVGHHKLQQPMHEQQQQQHPLLAKYRQHQYALAQEPVSPSFESVQGGNEFDKLWEQHERNNQLERRRSREEAIEAGNVEVLDEQESSSSPNGA